MEQAGVSLFIVIAIIILVVGLCGCFYFCKCWRNKEQQPEAAAEAGQLVTHLDRNQEAAMQEKESRMNRHEDKRPSPSATKGKPEATADELAKLLPEQREKGRFACSSSDLCWHNFIAMFFSDQVSPFCDWQYFMSKYVFTF